MKIELTCSIVQDLLPTYIEKLTSDDTNDVIEEHLETCSDCKNTYVQMVADTNSLEKAPVIELKFLKKIKRTRLLAALMCIILTVFLSYLLYSSEYQFTMAKSDLSTAITEFTAPFKQSVDAYVLETEEKDGVLLVSFKDQSNADVYGIAKFLKGINQKYRIVNTKIASSNYSSVVQFFPIEIQDEQYVAVNGYNLSDDIRYYGLDYFAYAHPGYQSSDRIRKPLKFTVKNQQFLELYQADQLDRRFENTVKEAVYNSHLVTTSLYNADEMEITENYRIAEDAAQQVSSGTGKAELFLLYVYIAIVIGLGIIFTRYFLME